MNFFWKKKEKEEIRSCECQEQESNMQVGGLNFIQKLLEDNGKKYFSAFFAALEIISNLISTLPIYFTTNKDKETPELISLYSSLFNNGVINKFNLMKNLISDVYKKGNGFLYIIRDSSGKPSELQYLDANDVNIRYIKVKNELYYTCPSIIKGPIDKMDIIHIYKNTEDGYTGKGIMYYAAQTLKLCGFSEQQAINFFSQGCNLSGILTYQGNLSDKQKAEIRENWSQTHGNGKGGVAVLPGNMNYHQLGSNAKDAQLLESRVFNITELARYFTISPTLLGELSHSSFNNIEQSQLNLLINTLNPIITLLEEEFTRKLWPNKMKVKFDENIILRADKQSESNYYSTLTKSGILSVNEARVALGYNKIDKPEYDELIIPFTDITQNKITPGEENGGNGDNNVPGDNNKDGKDEDKINQDKDEE